MIDSIILSLVSGLVSGVIASGIVAWWFNCRDKRQWSSVRQRLVKQLRTTLTGVLSTIRTAVDVEPPHIEEISSDNDLNDFFKFQLIDKFQAFEQKVMYMPAEKQKTLFANFRNAQEALRELGHMFISLKSADPWYAETVLELMNKVFSATIMYSTFPEIGMEKYNDDRRLIGGRHVAFNSLKALCEFAYTARISSLISDVAGDSLE